jgi:hypothetical protein
VSQPRGWTRQCVSVGVYTVDKTFCVWVWVDVRWALLECKPVSVTQAAAMLLISDRPLMFLAEGALPPECEA